MSTTTGTHKREPMPLFPFASLTITALISMIGLAGVGWMSTAALEDLARTDVYPELQTHLRDIVLYDEVLTMAARMAVATGEARWIERYEAHEPRLATALEEARTLDAGFARFIVETAQANDELVAIERAALAAVRRGQRDGVMGLLDSPRYQALKGDYKQAMEQAIAGVRIQWTQTIAQQQRLTSTARTATIIAGLLLALIWGLSVRALDGWRNATMVARRNTEAINARLEDAVSAGRLGVFALPDRRGPGELSARGRAVLGVAPGSVFGEETFVARVDAADRAALVARLQASWGADGDEPVQTELRVEKPDGGSRWIRAAWRVDRRRSGATLHGVVQDIDDERRLTELLTERAAAHLRLADERLSDLQALVRDLMSAELHERQRLARILHDEVQQFLVAARMRAALWCETAAEAAAADGEAGAEAAARPAREILDLIDKAYAATRHLTAREQPAPVDALGFQGALAALARRVGDYYGLHVDLALCEEPPQLAADVAQFAHAVVAELLFNTVRHAGVSTAAVRVEVSGDRLVITVSDAGGGFDVGSLDRERRDGGFGLSGLRRQATAFDGRLSIHSAPGEGSRLILELPIGERRPTSRPVAAVAPARSGDAPLRVLLVDDSEAIRNLVASAIERLPGVEVVGQAATTPDGLALLGEQRPDVVVMDYTFDWGPGGADATRRIKAEAPEVFVIGFADFEAAVDRAAMQAAGADLIVRKGEIGALMAALRARAGEGAARKAKLTRS